MSFKRNTFDDDNGGSDDNGQPFQKRQRFDGDGGRGGRGRGRGRGDNFRGNRGGGGFRGRGGGGFNRFGNDNDDSGFVDRRGRGNFRGGGDRFNRDNDRFSRDNRGGGFRGRGGGGRGFGGNRFDDRGRGYGRGGGRGRGFGDRRGGGFGGNRSFNDSIIKLNQDAPDFQNIPNENSENVSLRQFRGRYVVLFIYFKDKTYSCSTEQKAFRDLKSQFDKCNAVILGVSRDDAETHKDAIADAELNFSLLADTDSKIINSYGALDDNNRVNRSTFIISPEGKIAALWPRVFGFDRHPQEVLDKLKEITNGGANTSKKASHDNDNDNDNDQDDDNDNDDDDNNNPANDNDDDDDDDE